jgi:HEPN domain-containing protein
MTEAAIKESRRLLRIARADFAACNALIRAPDIRFANAAFHGQQALEKALKSVLTARGLDFGRTHNLVALAGQLKQAGEWLPDTGDALSLINPYAVTLRYDDLEEELLSAAVLCDVVAALIEWAANRVDVICQGDAP